MRRDPFQAIADPNRRAILSLLARERLSLNGISAHFPISRPAVSRHIRILRECGLVVVRRKGRERICEARLDRLGEVTDWIAHSRRLWEGRLDRLEDYLQTIQKGRRKRPG